jgi:hypothetical protein
MAFLIAVPSSLQVGERQTNEPCFCPSAKMAEPRVFLATSVSAQPLRPVT